MKALHKFADGREGMGIVEVPEPEIGADDLLIQVGAVGICGSDLHIWRDEKEHRVMIYPNPEYMPAAV